MEQARADNDRKVFRPHQLRTEFELNVELLTDPGFVKLSRIVAEWFHLFGKSAREKGFGFDSKFKLILQVERPKHAKPIETPDKL